MAAASFVSLGMVVLDELRFPDAPTMYDVAGGSGAYSTFGARVVAGSKQAHEVGCVIVAGQDFPATIQAQFESWGMNLVVVEEPGQQSTRGLLIYEDNVFGKKTFKYTTERLQPMPKDLTTSLLKSSSFHFLANPDLLQDQIKQLLELRREKNVDHATLFVWEPLPGLCKPEMRAAHLAAAKLVHVLSPNHLECLALFGHSEALDKDVPLDRQEVENCADALLDSGIGPDGTGIVVVRAGGDGCLVSSSSIPGRHKWLPPFYSNESSIVDATGAGNTFLGALTFAMSRLTSGDVVEAAVLASVATSFSLEQIGLPKLTIGGDEELWNGESFMKRCSEYRQKLKAAEPKS